MKHFLLLFTILLISLPVANSKKYGIAAKVNDQIITSKTLENRIELMGKSSGLGNRPDFTESVRAQAIKDLVEEKLKAQFAETIGLSVKNSEVEKGLQAIAKKQSLTYKEFQENIKFNEIPEQSLRNKIGNQILWQKVKAQYLIKNVQAGEKEIKEEVRKIKADLKKKGTEVYLSEITVNIEEDKEAALIKANNIAKKIKAGTSFSKIAKQFSDSSNASEGGIIGWVIEGQLKNSLRKRVKNTKSNSITGPFIDGNTYKIISVGNRKSNKDTKVSTEDARNSVLNRKLALEEKKLIEDLYKESYVEIIEGNS